MSLQINNKYLNECQFRNNITNIKKSNQVKFDYENYNKEKTISTFPPKDAPANVKRAWNDMVERLPNDFKHNLGLLQLQIHTNLERGSINIESNDINGYINFCDSLVGRLKFGAKFGHNDKLGLELNIINQFKEKLNMYK